MVVHLPIPLLASIVAVLHHPNLALYMSHCSQVQQANIRVLIDPHSPQRTQQADVDSAEGQQHAVWGTVVLQGTQAEVERSEEAVVWLVETATLRRRVSSDDAQRLLKHDLQ